MQNPILSATLNLTQNCNLACAYCFSHGRTARRLPLDVGKRCIDFLINNARETDELSLRGRKREVEVIFWGGEPFLEWDLMKKLALYGRKASEQIPIRFGATSNGTLLTEDKMDFLAEHRIGVMISFDGTPESHNRFRVFRGGEGSHVVVARNTEMMLKRFPGLRVRMSPYAEGIQNFCADVKYTIGLGIRNLLFSPVYESGWTEDRWSIFLDQCQRVTELLVQHRKNGTVIDIEHYKSYAKGDDSKWPCGAGRFFMGFDVDGAMYPCHRFNKFTDHRHWSQKELCIGHLDHGIMNPVFREKFLGFKPTKCGDCEFDKITPCHGGCYAVNYDLTGNIGTAPAALCEYTKMQSGVSRQFREKYGPKGFPEAREENTPRPQPEGIMAVLKQMEGKIAIVERNLK